jgi:long-subunit fatty acid transport protein
MVARLATAAALASLGATVAQAGGIDRSGQPIGIIFEEGRTIQLSFGFAMPSVDGNDVAAFGGSPSGNVANDFFSPSFGYKADINDRLSYAIILDQPFGADVSYPTGQSIALGGTVAKADAYALTGVMRYKFDENISVHACVRGQRADGNITLSGLAYGGVNGYQVALDNDIAFGWLVGAAYEVPEIALRVAITYNSKISHDFDTAETLAALGLNNTPTGTTDVDLPQSVNIDFQTGIAADTLLFGSIRWVDWSEFKLRPPVFSSIPGLEDGLINLDDTTTYEIGIGRRFSEKWAGSVAVSYEDEGDPLVSPLAPTNGFIGLTLAGVYTINEQSDLTVGVNYTRLGDAQPETGTPDVARADFTDNDSWGVGVRYSFKF